MKFLHVASAVLLALSTNVATAAVSVAVALVLDESGSIDNAEFRLETDGFIGAVDQIPSNGQVSVAVVGFASNADVILGNTVVDGTGKPAVRAALTNNPKAGGSTNMSLAISKAATVLAGSTAQSRVICLGTDGEPDSRSSTLAAANAAKAAGIRLVPVGIGLSSSGKLFLDSIASDPPIANPTSFEEFSQLVSTACIGVVKAALNIQLQPDPISFGTVKAPLIKALVKTAGLLNAGTNTASVTGIFLRGVDADQFKIVSVKNIPFTGIIFPFSLPAAYSTTIELAIAPDRTPADGTYDAELVLTAEDIEGNTIEAQLGLFAGTGYDVFSIDLVDAYPTIQRIDQQGRPLNKNGAPVSESDVRHADRKRTGMVTDGNARLFLRANTTVTAGTVRFSIVTPSPTYAVLHPLTGSPQDAGLLSITVPIEELTLGLGQATAILRAGDQFSGLADASEARFSVNACLLDKVTGNCGPLIDQSAVLEKRPPVVLIHGIWASEASMKESKDIGVIKALENASFQVGYFGYSATGDDSADAGPTQVMTPDTKGLYSKIVSECESLQDGGVACTRADLVTHSMGGLVARKFVFDNKHYREGPILYSCNICDFSII
ncbi:VWA domain-containing protein [Propionivibrio sp.]|uniref:VWA domain-containing protein n=1 Tax=Propionivibrio sp. TaxID=2212460 RepID=UPI003BF1FD2E